MIVTLNQPNHEVEHAESEQIKDQAHMTMVIKLIEELTNRNSFKQLFFKNKYKICKPV